MSWRWLGFSLLALVTVVSAISVVYSRHQHRITYAELVALERLRDELNIEFDRLQIEIATLADTGRVEEQAARALQMRFPKSDDIVVVKP